MQRVRNVLRTLLAQNATPHQVAAGFSLGLCLSLVPVPFAGMALALGIAPLLRWNLPATYLGTAVVNPVTGPFVYATEYAVGLWVRGHTVPSFQALTALRDEAWWDLMRSSLADFATGTVSTVAVAGPVSYGLVRALVRRSQHKRSEPRPQGPSRPHP